MEDEQQYLGRDCPLGEQSCKERQTIREGPRSQGVPTVLRRPMWSGPLPGFFPGGPEHDETDMGEPMPTSIAARLIPPQSDHHLGERVSTEEVPHPSRAGAQSWVRRDAGPGTLTPPCSLGSQSEDLGVPAAPWACVGPPEAELEQLEQVLGSSCTRPRWRAKQGWSKE